MHKTDRASRTRRLRLPRCWPARLALAVTVLAALAVPAAWASDRFADVPPSNPHHTDINTIARAGITTGCNPPTNNLYCPEDAVTRQQMGSFLARTLRSATPVVRQGASVGAVDPDGEPVVCQTADFTPSVQVHAFAHGEVSLRQAGAGELGYFVDLMYSTNGGASWTFVPPVRMHATTFDSGAWSNGSQTGRILVGAGITIRFGMQVGRFTGTVDADDSRCQVLAEFRYADAGASALGASAAQDTFNGIVEER